MTRTDFRGLDRLLREVVEEQKRIAGAVALVRHGDGICFHEAYGRRQRVPVELPMTQDTIFDLASLTKSVGTGLLALRLTTKGQLDLGARLDRHFGGPIDEAKRRIDVRALLCHRAGFPAWRPFYRSHPPGACPVDAAEVIQRILAEPLEGVPGGQEIYSDLGYILLGRILEESSELALDELFRNEIGAPLGLDRTGFRGIRAGAGAVSPPAEPVAATEDCPWRGRVLVGEVHDENGWALGGAAGHAGLFSTARDVDRVAGEIFRGLEGASEILTEQGLRAFFRRQGTAPGESWALGWDTPSEQGSCTGSRYSPNSVGHNGFTGTSLWIDLDRRISVVLLTNRVHPFRENEAIRTLRPRVHDAVQEALGVQRG